MQGLEQKRVKKFKYLGSKVQTDGEGGEKRVQPGWGAWKK